MLQVPSLAEGEERPPATNGIAAKKSEELVPKAEGQARKGLDDGGGGLKVTDL